MAKATPARRLWWSTETFHAIVYFAPEKKAAYEAAGLKGGWMGYFASRGAALGPVDAPVVTALFYNFAPTMVARAIPDAWRFSSPERVLEARYSIVEAVLQRLLGDEVASEDVSQALDLCRRALEHCTTEGRALFAAHAGLEWPKMPAVALWHACTSLREHRGDGHVAALVAHEIDGIEAHVLQSSIGRFDEEAIRPFRGWTGDEWAAARARLAERDLVDGAGLATTTGAALLESIESMTDRLAAPPWDALGEDCDRLAEHMSVLDRLILGGRDITFPNPIGLPDQAPV